MFWLVIKSYRSNFRRYAFSIVALALATVISALGLSGVKLMASMVRYPLAQVIGGHIMVKDQSVEYSAVGGAMYSDGDYQLFSYSRASRIIHEVFPEAEVTATLLAPTYFENCSSHSMLLGRDGGLCTWYLRPSLKSGRQLEPKEADKLVAVLPSSLYRPEIGEGEEPELQLRVAHYQAKGEQQAWDFTGTEQRALTVVGKTTGLGADGGWTHLCALQQVSGVPSDLVHWVGIALPGLHADADDRLTALNSRLNDELPELHAISIDQLGEIMVTDFAKLRRAAALYTPLLLVIAIQVVAATGLAVANSRRRDLSMLRVIGLSYRRIWRLFALECSVSALAACGLGFLTATLLARSLFGSGNISLLPFALALVISIVTSSLIGKWSVAAGVSSVLRNS